MSAHSPNTQITNYFGLRAMIKQEVENLVVILSTWGYIDQTVVLVLSVMPLPKAFSPREQLKLTECVSVIKKDKLSR